MRDVRLVLVPPLAAAPSFLDHACKVVEAIENVWPVVVLATFLLALSGAFWQGLTPEMVQAVAVLQRPVS